MRIYIGRHGQDQDNADGILNGWRDRPLTKLGISQAVALASRIAEMGLTFDAVYSSELVRANVTGRVITTRLRLNPPVIIPGLIERNFGVMTGQPIADIEKLCAPNIIKTEKVIYFLSPKDAETFPALLERGMRVLSQIQTAHPEDTVLLATSGDIGKMIYAAYYGIPWKDILTMFHFDNSELLLLAEDSPAEELYA
tara:strand:- start:1806 stop:2396 length:591 start_codon:yes stop_codon:yes gene_type:complete